MIDLYDRSVVATLNGKEITSKLAIKTIKKALATHPSISNELILHSDQETQFASKVFVDFCSQNHITQSMKKAGYPYDNAPMERYFNTLKCELINQHYYHNDQELNDGIYDYAYVWSTHFQQWINSI